MAQNEVKYFTAFEIDDDDDMLDSFYELYDEMKVLS